MNKAARKVGKGISKAAKWVGSKVSKGWKALKNLYPKMGDLWKKWEAAIAKWWNQVKKGWSAVAGVPLSDAQMDALQRGPDGMMMSKEHCCAAQFCSKPGFCELNKPRVEALLQADSRSSPSDEDACLGVCCDWPQADIHTFVQFK